MASVPGPEPIRATRSIVVVGEVEGRQAPLRVQPGHGGVASRAHQAERLEQVHPDGLGHPPTLARARPAPGPGWTAGTKAHYSASMPSAPTGVSRTGAMP